jgi:hypothetical protein
MGEVFGCAGLEDFSFEEEVGAVGDGEGFVYVVVGDEDSDVAVFEVGDDVLYVFYGYGVDSGKGFIEEDELGVDCEGAGYFCSAPFASAEEVATVGAHALEAVFIEEGFELLLLFGFGELRHFEDGHDVVLHAELAEDAGFLRQVADAGLSAPVHGQVGYLFSVKVYFAFIGFDKAYYHVEAGGFAGSVGAKQSDYLSLVYIDGDVVDYCAAFVFLDEVFCAKEQGWFRVWGLRFEVGCEGSLGIGNWELGVREMELCFYH